MGTKIRYTAARTGIGAISVTQLGLVKKGDVIEVDDDVAERFLTEHPTGEPGTVDDLENAWNLDQLRVMARDHRIDDSGRKRDLAERIYAVDPNIGTPPISKADFEIVGDDVQPDVVPFGDKKAPAPAPLDPSTTDEASESDASEGVNDGI